ncbi:hypothetical protein GTV15_04015, partial [Streptomyces sp. SID7803]|nr:hypothetical protein [Streptomyces sp. SID7803]
MVPLTEKELCGWCTGRGLAVDAEGSGHHRGDLAAHQTALGAGRDVPGEAVPRRASAGAALDRSAAAQSEGDAAVGGVLQLLRLLLQRVEHAVNGVLGDRCQVQALGIAAFEGGPSVTSGLSAGSSSSSSPLRRDRPRPERGGLAEPSEGLAAPEGGPYDSR